MSTARAGHNLSRLLGGAGIVDSIIDRVQVVLLFSACIIGILIELFSPSGKLYLYCIYASISLFLIALLLQPVVYLWRARPGDLLWVFVFQLIEWKFSTGESHYHLAFLMIVLAWLVCRNVAMFLLNLVLVVLNKKCPDVFSPELSEIFVSTHLTVLMTMFFFLQCTEDEIRLAVALLRGIRLY